MIYPLCPPPMAFSDIAYSSKEKVSLLVQAIATPILLTLGAALNVMAGEMFFGVVVMSSLPVGVVLAGGVVLTAVGIFLVVNVARQLSIFEKRVQENVKPLIAYGTQVSQLESEEKRAAEQAKLSIETYWLRNREQIIQELKDYFPAEDIDFFDGFYNLQLREISYQKIGGNYYCFLNHSLAQGAVKKVHLALSVEGLVTITETLQKESFTHIPRPLFDLLKKCSLSNASFGGILPLEEMENVKGTQFVVQKFCNGGDLLESCSFFRKDLKLYIKDIARGLLTALKVLHEKRIIHHDVRLENVFLERNENTVRAFLGDFDLAHELIGSQENERLRPIYDRKQNVRGNFLYRAPEFFSKDKGDPFKQDVWTAGLILWFLASNSSKEFQGAFWTQLEKLNLDEWFKTPVELSKVSGKFAKCFDWKACKDKNLKAILQSMLEVDPNKRCTIQEAYNLFEEYELSH